MANYLNKYLPKAALLLCIALAVASSSCKSKKKLTSPIDNSSVNRTVKKEVYDAIDKNRFNFEYLTISGSCDYSGLMVQMGVNMRMERDKKIWVSVSVLFLEAARIMATQDSIHIINYNDKTVTSRSFAYIEQIIGTKLTLGQLQDILVGNSIMNHDNNSTFENTGEQIKVITRLNQYLFEEIFHTEHLRPVKINGEESGTSNTLALEYDNFTLVNNRLLPRLVKLNAVTNMQAISATLKYSDISTGTITDWPFRIPPTYERK